MKKIVYLSLLFSSILFACKTKPPQKGLSEVNNPFSGNKYEASRRYFRATASGESINMETSRDKAMLTAKQRLASSVQTTMKSVSENYANERKAEGGAEFSERFQSLTREVLNQVIVDIATIGEKTYQKEDRSYVTYVAIESRKKTVYRKLAEITKQRSSLSAKDKEYVQDMINKAIKDLDDGD